MRSVLKRRLRKLLLGYDVSTYYFSQSGEDQILASIFTNWISNQRLGFYVDVGCYHPVSHSNTFHFHKLGWKGINIDARNGTKSIFDKERPNDINLEIGVGGRNEIREFYETDGLGLMNSFNKENMQNLGQEKRIVNSRNISIKTLEYIFDNYLPANTNIAFLSIDVEGLELEVLQSNNWQKWKPLVVLLETEGTNIQETLNRKVSKFMQSEEYELIGKTLVTKNVSTLIWKMKAWDINVL